MRTGVWIFLGMAPVFNGAIMAVAHGAADSRVYYQRSAKRSKALWGHNLTRDSRVDGASMTCCGAPEESSGAHFVLP